MTNEEVKKLSATRPTDEKELELWRAEIKTSVYQSASQRLMNTCITKLCGNKCHGEDTNSERKIGISDKTGGICHECYKFHFKAMVESEELEDQFKNNPFNIILSHTNHYCQSLAKHISDSIDNDRFTIEKTDDDELKICLEPEPKKELKIKK